MRKHLMLLAMIFAIQACSKDAPPPPPAPAAGAPNMGGVEMGDAPAKAAAPAAAAPATPAGSAPTAPAADTTVAAPAEAPKEKSVLEEMKAGQLQEFYNPSGKRDPFKPFEGGEIVYTATAKAPLERFELNQLELTAIVWGIARPKVLFRAPDGYSYIAQVGTGIGRNRGRITKVTKNRVLIAEEFRDPSGQYVARESEFQMDSDDKADKVTRTIDLKYSDE